MNAIELSLFASRMQAVCDEMGAHLRCAAFSPNIRDRLDFSCAIFDATGELAAQAAHIPVHLGSMAYAMRGIVNQHNWQAGDMLMLNDPFQGGTHLPDVTVIAPLFMGKQLAGFIANRAHHADIGSDSPGSMPLSRSIHEEGLLISPCLLTKAGVAVTETWQALSTRLGSHNQTIGDLSAQISANNKGLERLSSLMDSLGLETYRLALASLNKYAERLARDALESLPAGEYRYTDFMDDDGQGTQDIKVAVCVRISKAGIQVDFTGTVKQVPGNINCPLPVAAAAVFYVFRGLMPAFTPACAGVFRPITLHAPTGCLVNATTPAAVAAGNVETSMRIVDCLLGALAQPLPAAIPAASAGSMNNVALGWSGPGNNWDYYETIGGGAGAAAGTDGRSAVQTHMTNTLNTPIEVLEMNYPLRVVEYAVRRGSGGSGRYVGGNGIVREYEFLERAQGTILSERRKYRPWGRDGGEQGLPGVNTLNGETLPAKVQFQLKAKDRLRIASPGGGGFGLKTG